MKLNEAVEILNERIHRGHALWAIDRPNGDPDNVAVTGPDRHDDLLTPFVAIAIAEKYVASADAGWELLEHLVLERGQRP